MLKIYDLIWANKIIFFPNSLNNRKQLNIPKNVTRNGYKYGLRKQANMHEDNLGPRMWVITNYDYYFCWDFFCEQVRFFLWNFTKKISPVFSNYLMPTTCWRYTISYARLLGSSLINNTKTLHQSAFMGKKSSNIWFLRFFLWTSL